MSEDFRESRGGRKKQGTDEVNYTGNFRLGIICFLAKDIFITVKGHSLGVRVMTFSKNVS